VQAVVPIVITDEETVSENLICMVVKLKPAVPSETLVSTVVCAVAGAHAIKYHAVPSLAIPQG
jgi:hypothetical protein